MYKDTITLFCFHELTGLWYTTVFTGVHLTEIKADTSTADAGTVGADTVEAIVHVSPDRSSKDAEGTVRQYVGPKAYAALEDPAGRFTFQAERDFFVVGDHASEPLRDDDYESGLYDAMNKAMDGVYMISSSVFYRILPHFEIGGR